MKNAAFPLWLGGIAIVKIFLFSLVILQERTYRRAESRTVLCALLCKALFVLLHTKCGDKNSIAFMWI